MDWNCGHSFSTLCRIAIKNMQFRRKKYHQEKINFLRRRKDKMSPCNALCIKVNEKNQVNILKKSGKWNQRKSNCGDKSTKNIQCEGRQMKLR
jgi:hypothetical protein